MSNTVVQTNVMAINSHRNLGIVGNAQNRASQRLSSGFRINSAADDAAGLAISEKMRAQIRGLDQASRNGQDGISLIQTAEGAMNIVNDMVIRVRELVVQAANDTNAHDSTNMAQSDRIQIQREINALLNEIDDITLRTEFNTRTLLDGSLSAGRTRTSDGPLEAVTEFQVGHINLAGLNATGFDPDDLDIDMTALIAALNTLKDIGDGSEFRDFLTNGINGTNVGSILLQGMFEAFIGSNATEYADQVTNPLQGVSFADFMADQANANAAAVINWFNTARVGLLATLNSFDDPAQFGLGVRHINFNGLEDTFDAAQIDAQAIVEALQGMWDAADDDDEYGYALRALFANGINASNFETVYALAVEIEAASTGAHGHAIAAVTTAPLEDLFDAFGVTGLSDWESVVDNDEAMAVVNWFNQNAARFGQILTAGSDEATGGNDIWFHIGANSGQGIRLNIEAVNVAELSAVGLGLTALSVSPQTTKNVADGFYFAALRNDELVTGDGVMLESGEEINRFIDAIDAALAHVAGQRANLGATQNRLEFTIQNLDISSENLSAANSRIRDADMAQEMMRFTQSNVLQQAAISMLAQANQAPQSILQLLR